MFDYNCSVHDNDDSGEILLILEILLTFFSRDLKFSIFLFSFFVRCSSFASFPS